MSKIFIPNSMDPDEALKLKGLVADRNFKTVRTLLLGIPITEFIKDESVMQPDGRMEIYYFRFNDIAWETCDSRHNFPGDRWRDLMDRAEACRYMARMIDGNKVDQLAIDRGLV